MLKLELGSGNNPRPGYEHLDIVSNCPHLEYVASADSIPLADNIVDEILAVHLLEHFPWHKAVDVLKEWHRVLKVGGKLEIHTPNLEYIIKGYLEENWQKEIKNPGWSFPFGSDKDKTAWINYKLFSTDGGFNNHKACFDYRWLKQILLDIGFCRVERKPVEDTLVVLAWK